MQEEALSARRKSIRYRRECSFISRAFTDASPRDDEETARADEVDGCRVMRHRFENANIGWLS